MFERDDRSYRLPERVLSVPIDDEAILLTVDSGKYFGIKGAMRHLLEDLRQGLTFGEMVALTCRRYGVDAALARQDLAAILPKLVDAGILVCVRTPAAGSREPSATEPVTPS
jgi:hypothetical protein